jgi:hypothetical protein
LGYHVLSPSVMAADGGAPAYEVDHEVFVVLDRFKADENLVINMAGVWTVRPDWVVRLPSVFTVHDKITTCISLAAFAQRAVDSAALTVAPPGQ